MNEHDDTTLRRLMADETPAERSRREFGEFVAGERAKANAAREAREAESKPGAPRPWWRPW